MPSFRNSSATNRTAENGLLSSKGGHCPGFSLEGACAVRFQGGHKANAMRSEDWGFSHGELTFVGILESNRGASHKPVSG
jgi:hypothetical protein